MLYTKIVKGCS